MIKFLLGWELIPGLDPSLWRGDQPGEVMRAIEVIGSISCVLLGAYPMVLLLTRWFEKPLMRVGNLLKSTIWLPAAWSLPRRTISRCSA